MHLYMHNPASIPMPVYLYPIGIPISYIGIMPYIIGLSCYKLIPKEWCILFFLCEIPEMCSEHDEDNSDPGLPPAPVPLYRVCICKISSCSKMAASDYFCPNKCGF